MLIITNLIGQTEPVADYKSLEINEEVNGDFSISCVLLNTENNRFVYPLIAEESIIEHEGQEYRIKKITKEINRKQILAPHIYFDLIDHQVYEIKGGTMYVNDAFSFVLAGTGWTFEVVGNIPPQLLFNFGEDNALSLIRKACEAFNCEVKIEPNRHLKIYKQIGKDDDYQFRYKHNIKAIKESVDTTKLATVINGYGGNNLQVTYTSPNHAVFGERHAQPVRDDNIIESTTMIEKLKRELVDTPDVSIELEAILLEGAGLGDKVWLIHEKLGIEFQTRIMAQKRRPKTPAADTVTLGNRKQTLSNLLTETKIEINENAKQFRSKIEQTNDRITLEVESVNESIATLEIKADNIQLGVTELNGRMGNAESQINIQAGLIESKVSYSEYNGPTITSKITQDPYSISLLANNLNLQGLVTFTNLNTPGQSVIDGGNIYGSLFQVGRGTGSTLTMTSYSGSHGIVSNDAAGFSLQSNGSLSLRAGYGYAIFTRFAPLAVQDGMRVDGGIAEFNTSAYLNGSTIINQIALNNDLATLETQIKAWANNKFVAK